MVVFIQALANTGYAQTPGLTIREENKTVKEILTVIEEKSKVYFFYSDQDVDLNRKVTIDLKDQPLSKVLEILFKDSSSKFVIDGNQVYISKKPGSDKPAPAKKKKVSGVITDNEGLPAIGANVLIDGTTTGTVSDINGVFSLEVPENGRLKISYIGYKTEYVSVEGKSSFNILLEPAEQKLDEVVIVAYGAQKKESVTGAISSIQTKDLKKSSAANLNNALAGRISGLSSVQSSGQPGNDNARMYLRGAATTNSSDPLILIDGVPRDNMGVLDPNEIESISVLKDASATAVFGVRGANGAILITTKRGEVGKMQLSVNLETSLQSFTREPQRLDSWDYMRLKNEASLNDNLPIIYSDEEIAKYTKSNKTALEQYMYPSHFYYGEMMRRFAPQTRASVNMSGGTERMQYFVNVSYIHQGGQFKIEKDLEYDPQVRMDRYGFRANVDYKLARSLKAFLNMGSYIEKVAMPSTKNYGDDPTNSANEMMSDVFRSLQYSRPFEMGPTTIAMKGTTTPAGEVIKFDNLLRSGYEIVNRSGYRNDTRMNFNGSYGMEWDMSFLTKGLSLKGMVSFDSYSSTVMNAHIGAQQYIARILTVGDESQPVFSTNMSKGTMGISKIAGYRYNINLQASLNYSRTFAEKHRVGGLLLAQRDNWESANPIELPYNVLGLVGRVTYSYDDRYLGEFNMGYNGSEQFTPTKRFGFFPAVSLGWRVSNEAFFKPLLPYVSGLKIRGSYGKVGNDKMGDDRFLYLDKMYYQDRNTNGSYGEFFLGSLSNGHYINEGMLGNMDVGWEAATKQNYGIDIQLFNSLDLSFDYFLEKRERILIGRNKIPELQGVELKNIPRYNMGKVDNHGFEIEIGYNKRINSDLLVFVKGNLGYAKNKVIFMDEPQLAEDNVYRYRQTGYPLGTIFGYEIDYGNGNGYLNTQEEIDKYVDKNGNQITYGFGKYGLGDFKYVDQNGDGVVNEKDQVPLGKTMIPEISYGLSLGATYKWFDFSVLFQGLGGTSMCYSNEGVYETLYSGNYFDYHRTAWTKERYESGAEITYPALHLTSGPNHTANSFFVMDRSFLRLKNAEIGFTFPEKWIRYLKMSNIRIYVSGQNLITWDKLKMNTLDPESFSPTANLSGIVYPMTKMYNFGISATF